MEKLQLLISQIAATRLHEMAGVLTERMRQKFDKMAEVRCLLEQLSKGERLTVQHSQHQLQKETLNLQ